MPSRSAPFQNPLRARQRRRAAGVLLALVMLGLFLYLRGQYALRPRVYVVLPIDWPKNNPGALSPDGRTVGMAYATGALDCRVYLRDIASGSGRAFDGHMPMAAVTTVLFSPDAQTIAAWGPCRLELWHIASGRRSGSITTPYVVEYIQFTPDGRRVLGSDGQDVVMWDVATGALVKRLPAPPGRKIGVVRVAPDGGSVAVCESALDGSRGTLALWDLASGRRRWQRALKSHNEARDRRTFLAFAPGGGLLAACGGNTDTCHLTLHDTASGAPRGMVEVKRSPREFANPVFNRSGTQVLVGIPRMAPTVNLEQFGLEPNQFRVYDVPSLKLRHGIITEEASFPGAFWPDDNTIAALNPDGTLRLWPLG